jgi:hypothetical protein
MVYSLPCFLFVSFFFCLRSVLRVLRACFLSKQDKNSRALYIKLHANMAHSFLKRAQVCDGVDTVIVFARIFWCSFLCCFFFQFLYFCLLFFGETFQSSSQRFFIFFNNKYGWARKKKHNSFFLSTTFFC